VIKSLSIYIFMLQSDKFSYNVNRLYLSQLTSLYTNGALTALNVKKVKVSICIVHLTYDDSNALFVTNPSRQPHGHHVQPADTG